MVVGEPERATMAAKPPIFASAKLKQSLHHGKEQSASYHNSTNFCVGILVENARVNSRGFFNPIGKEYTQKRY